MFGWIFGWILEINGRFEDFEGLVEENRIGRKKNRRKKNGKKE